MTAITSVFLRPILSDMMPEIAPPMTMPRSPHVVRDPISAPGLGLSGQNVWATNRFVELTIMKS